VCVKDYARDENVLQRVDPVFGERRFNPAPVRIIIDKQGKVKHTHFLSAFPDQVKPLQTPCFSGFQTILARRKARGSRNRHNVRTRATPGRTPGISSRKRMIDLLLFVKEFCPRRMLSVLALLACFFNRGTGRERHHRLGPQSEPRQTSCGR